MLEGMMVTPVREEVRAGYRAPYPDPALTIGSRAFTQLLPTRPGLGFEIDEREAECNRAYQEELGGEFYYPSDGSVADW